MLRLLSLATALAFVAPAQAQHDHHAHDGHDHAGHNHAAPDDGDLAPPGLPAGLSQAEHDGLLSGAGLGLAAAADRNGYPGPLHVLQLADSLALSPRQRHEAEQIRAEMLAEAVPLGAEIVAAERQLDALFASGTVTERWMALQTARIGELRARLRAVHLAAHLEMRAALAPEQVAAYDRLRARP